MERQWYVIHHMVQGTLMCRFVQQYYKDEEAV